jgi:ATP phosphoribosyltransferase
VLEAQMESHVTEVLRLGFGKCALQVQVPEASSIKTASALAGKRVVTSFEVLAGQYFDKIDKDAGLQGDQRTQIEYVGGSVEAACALGLADGIGVSASMRSSLAYTDGVVFAQWILLVRFRPLVTRYFLTPCTESGETMRAAGLHAIATVLDTEAVLIRSTTHKPRSPEQEKTIEMITKRIAGVIAAGKYVVVQYNVPREKLDQATKVTPGRRAPTISPLEENNWLAVSAMVEKKKSAQVMDELTTIGAEDILVFNLDNCRV